MSQFIMILSLFQINDYNMDLDEDLFEIRKSLQSGLPRIQDGVLWGIPKPSIEGFRLYSTVIIRPITERSMLLKFNSASLKIMLLS